ncbi:MAG: hypothetical protein Kilf2KO_00590 [Rhodospirillales bacterium]
MVTARTAGAPADFERYPLNRRDGAAYRRLLADCARQLEQRGAAVLEGFVPPERLGPLLAEVTPALPKAFFKVKAHNPYLVADDPSLPPDHPRNRKQRTDSATVAYDDLPADSALAALYRDADFMAFLAEVLGFPALYPYADRLTPVNLLHYGPGQSLGWHFDVSTFVVTLLLSAPESGGAFEYVPFLRGPGAENYAQVDRVLKGEAPDLVQTLKQDPGALVIFRGSRTLHRVSRIEGEAPRLMAVFSYAPEPGTRSDPHNMKTFYGRAG